MCRKECFRMTRCLISTSKEKGLVSLYFVFFLRSKFNHSKAFLKGWHRECSAMTKFELQYQTNFRVQHDVQIQRLIIPLSSLHKPSVECYTHLRPKLKKKKSKLTIRQQFLSWKLARSCILEKSCWSSLILIKTQRQWKAFSEEKYFKIRCRFLTKIFFTLSHKKLRIMSQKLRVTSQKNFAWRHKKLRVTSSNHWLSYFCAKWDNQTDRHSGLPTTLSRRLQ